MAIKPVQLVKLGAGGSEPEYENISAPSTCIVGQLLVKTDGAAVVAADAAAAVSYVAPVAGTSTVPGLTTLSLIKIRPMDTYEMNTFHTTSTSSSVPASGLDAQSDYGIKFVTVSSVAYHAIDLENTSQKVVRIIENTDSSTTLYPRCRVQFLPAAVSFQ